MTTLDFLSPDRAKAGDGFSPVLRSSMERHQHEHGAAFAERDGWLVPVSFPGEADRLARVGLVDLSHLGKLEVRGEGPADESRDVIAWYPCRPDLAVVLCRARDAFLLRSTLARRFKLVLDQTGAWNILALVGPDATAVLRRLTHLHEFPASGPVAQVSAHIIERDGGYWIVFPQEYGHSLWEIAADAAEPFGGGPVGVGAITRAGT